MFLQKVNSTEAMRIRFPFHRSLLLLGTGISFALVAALYLWVFDKSEDLSPAMIRRIEATRNAYIITEGPKARGRKFEQLVSLIDSPEDPGKLATGLLFNLADVIDLLGPPDVVKEDRHGLALAYFYKDANGGDSAILVYFLPGDQFAEFGYNSRDVIDYSTWQKYESPNSISESEPPSQEWAEMR